MHRWALSGLLIAVTAVWGWTFVVVREAVAEYGVFRFLALRFVLGSVALVWAGRRLPREGWRASGLLGLLLVVGYAFQTWGLRYTTATNCGLITGLLVVWTPLFDRWWNGVYIPTSHWLAVVLALGGLALLTGNAPTTFQLGDLLTLIGAAGFGAHLVLLGRFSKQFDVLALAHGQLTAAAGLFGLIAVLLEPPEFPTPRVWGAILLTGLLATAAAFAVQTFVQRRLSAVRTSLILLMEPIFAALFGYWLAGDRLHPIQWVGAGLLFAALLVGEMAPHLRRLRRPAAA